jgi:hypothetical protein
LGITIRKVELTFEEWVMKGKIDDATAMTKVMMNQIDTL